MTKQENRFMSKPGLSRGVEVMKQRQEEIQELKEDKILAKAQQESSREAWPERESFTHPLRNPGKL